MSNTSTTLITKSTYPLSFPRNSTGWKISQANTFRNRSGKILDIYGTNLQNPSDNISRIYVPDNGKIFVSADLAGAEALIVAFLCRDGNFRQLFVNNIKPHVFVAMHLFASHWQREIREKQGITDFNIIEYLRSPVPVLKTLPHWKLLDKLIKGDKVKYYIGKKSCHSFNYGQSWKSFIFVVLTETEGQIVLSNEEAERIYNIYHSIFPEIQGDFHVLVENILAGSAPRVLRNLFGHPKEIYQFPITDKVRRECIAFIPQSTVGELTNEAFCTLQDYIEDTQVYWDLLNNKHDSVLLQCPNSASDIQMAATQLDKSLAKTFTNFAGESFTMKTEIKVGMNWSDWHETKNLQGMKEYELAAA